MLVLLSALLRFFSYTSHGLFLEYQNAKLYSRKKLLAAFLVPLLILVALLAGLRGVHALDATRVSIQHDMMQGMQSILKSIAAARETDLEKALQYAQKSGHEFLKAKETIDGINPILLMALKGAPGIGKKARSADYAVQAGLNISESAQLTFHTIGALTFMQSSDTPDAMKALSLSNTTLQSITPRLSNARALFDTIDSRALPSEYSELFNQAHTQLIGIEQTARLLSRMAQALSDSLGNSTVKRYLVLFKNNAELRATGGFLGSFALLDVVGGQIKHVEIPPGGPYDLRGSFHERLNPPEPLRLVASEWQFQDANWWADFPTSAKKILWFYTKSGGPTVDGVIAINASLIPRILSLTGPITLDAYGKTFASDTVLPELQKAVEIEYDKTANTPKQIIADFFPRFLTALSNPAITTSPKFIALMLDAFDRKDIQIYFRNGEYQKLATELNITGEIKKHSGDHSMIVSSNIGGGKSDSVLSTDVKHAVSINEDGGIDVRIAFRRTHVGSVGEQFTGMQHNDYVRIYAPLGSRLIDAQGFSELPPNVQKPLLPNHTDDADVRALHTNALHLGSVAIDQWDEGTTTVFAGWVFTKPSTESSFALHYQLQGRMRDEYSLLVQHQSGSTIHAYSVEFTVPKDMPISWWNGGFGEQRQLPRGIQYSTNDFHSDSYFGFSIKK